MGEGLDDIVEGTKKAGNGAMTLYKGSSEANKKGIKYGSLAGLAALIPFDFGTSLVVGGITYAATRWYQSRKQQE